MSQKIADGFGQLGELEDYHYSFVQNGKITLVGRKCTFSSNIFFYIFHGIHRCCPTNSQLGTPRGIWWKLCAHFRQRVSEMGKTRGKTFQLEIINKTILLSFPHLWTTRTRKSRCLSKTVLFTWSFSPTLEPSSSSNFSNGRATLLLSCRCRSVPSVIQIGIET